MQPLHLFQTIHLPDPVQAMVDEHFSVTDAVDAADSAEALSKLQSITPAVDALFVSITGPRLTTAQALAALPSSVKAIATYSVGLDHIDLEAARARGIAIFNTPRVLDDSVADTAMLLILGAARRGTESIALIREGRWQGWTPQQLIGLELAGRSLGVVGMGAIGKKIAGRAAAFGMSIIYTDRAMLADAPSNAEFVPDADELVRRSDVLALACPSTPETRYLIDRRRLAMARPELIVVNIGRGDLVDDDALIEALAQRRIFAAGLDVFNGEPALDRRYHDLPNLFMTPHIGSSTIEARQRMAQVLIDALLAWRRGEWAFNRVI